VGGGGVSTSLLGWEWLGLGMGREIVLTGTTLVAEVVHDLTDDEV
jgi:hypothetical protein